MAAVEVILGWRLKPGPHGSSPLNSAGRTDHLMDTTRLPFNRLVGIIRAQDPDFLLELPASDSLANHLGQIHAVAQLALAEASSGEGLIRTFPDLVDRVVPVVRRLESKFRRPAEGTIRARARIAEEAAARLRADVAARGRGLVAVDVEVVDDSGAVTLSVVVEWFIRKKP